MANPKNIEPQVKNSFKISELPEIKNLDTKDVFLVSDEENGKIYTRKVSFAKLMNVIAQHPDFVQLLLQDDDFEHQVDTRVDNYISSAITEINGGNAFEQL